MRRYLLGLVLLTACGSHAGSQQIVQQAAPSVEIQTTNQSVVPTDRPVMKPAKSLSIGVAATADAHLGDPVSVTGLKIGDRMEKSGGPNFYDKDGRIVPEKLPLWLAAVTTSGVVVGFLKMDPEWETLPGDEARKRLNPWSNIWNQEGTMLIGCLTADGPVLFEGEAAPCN